MRNGLLENNTSNMRTKILLVFVSLVIFGLLFKSSIFDFFKKDVSGCTDFTALNYNPLASIDDSSCISDELINLLQLDIDSLKISAWNIDDYNFLKAKINISFKSIAKKGSKQERDALENLEMAYMSVLKKATIIEVANCFKSASILKNEVLKLYKTNNINTEISKAQYWFNELDNINSYNVKVNNLLKNNFDLVKVEFDDLKTQLIDFQKPGNAYDLMKCENLEKIILDCDSKLADFNDINVKYKIWSYENRWDQTNVKSYIKSKYLPYDWYFDKVMIEDLRLKKREKNRQQDKFSYKVDTLIVLKNAELVQLQADKDTVDLCDVKTYNWELAQLKLDYFVQNKHLNERRISNLNKDINRKVAEYNKCGCIRCEIELKCKSLMEL
ncbi:MAG: hypothetical protein HN564_06080 [Flavobacteriales bacterium]|nr:hypothetical protein [Flavobacteriales bacterium]